MPTTCSASCRGISRRLLLLLILLIAAAVQNVAAMTRSEAIRELGLKRQSKPFTPKELKAAYRKRSLETHPDKGGSADAFLRVAEAYEELLISEGASGATGGGERKFARRQRPSGTGTGPAGGGMSEEEMADQMKKAEDMFFDMFDDLFDEDTAGDAIDQLFAQFAGENAKLGYGMKMLRAFVKWAAPKLMKLLENEGTTISINGESMSGTEFKEWRERKRNARRAERIAEKDL